MKKILKKTLIVLIIFVISFLLFKEVLAFVILHCPLFPGVFEVREGESLNQITKNLKKEGFVRNEFPFYFYVLLTGKTKELKPGVYTCNPLELETIFSFAKRIINGESYKIKITITEGFNLDQIQKKLGLEPELTAGKIIIACPLNGFCPKVLDPSQPNLKDLKISDFKRDFSLLENAPNQASLEGFFFPDTYYFSPYRETKEVAKVFLNNFEKKLTPDLREEIKGQRKTIFEIITIASLLEKEVKTKEEKDLVSGILWKRLENGIPLQVDATITYITGKKTTKISKEETQIDSPYNTYKYKGLPPGPICNPGIKSIKSAIEPKESPFWYYLSSPGGETIFNETLEEHNLAKAKYLR